MTLSTDHTENIKLKLNVGRHDSSSKSYHAQPAKEEKKSTKYVFFSNKLPNMLCVYVIISSFSRIMCLIFLSTKKERKLVL